MSNTISNSYDKRIKKIYDNAEKINISNASKIVIMSDCHRGTGRWNDNFANNERITFSALNYYFNRGFTYIELGDGDELWENREYKDIINQYSNIYWIMSEFYKIGKLHMIYGNHDIVKKNKKYVEKKLSQFYCDNQKRFIPLLEDIRINEAIVLHNRDNLEEMFLIHGHQGDFVNDTIWPVTRWLVRYVWEPLEIIGFNNPATPPVNNYKNIGRKPKIQKWAEKNSRITISGHTHRPSYPDKNGFYYNSGSLIHPRCITALEIVSGKIKLVKWCVNVDTKMYMKVSREEL